jgi:hypothetical protein
MASYVKEQVLKMIGPDDKLIPEDVTDIRSCLIVQQAHSGRDKN